MSVAVGRLYLDDPLADLEDRNVERSTAEVVHGDGFIVLLVQTVGEGRGGRLIDDAEDVEPGNLAGVLRRLPLRVVEIRGDRDDRVGNFLTDVVLRCGLQLLQNHRGDLGRRVLLAADLYPRISVICFHDLVRHT